MMELPEVNANVWNRTCRRGGCLILLGAPFLVLGLCTLVGPLLPGQEVNGPWFLLPLFSLPFLGFGAWAVFGCSGLEIDRQSRTVTTWWGLLVPIRRNKRPLSQFRQVVVREELRGGSGQRSNYPVYAVRLTGPRQNVLVGEYPHDDEMYSHVRRLTEELARFCKLEMADATHDDLIVRDHDKLDESLGDHTRRLGRIYSLPARPETMLSSLEVSDTEVVVDLPETRRRLLSSKTKQALFVLAVAAGALILTIALRNLETSEIQQVVSVVAFIVVMSLLRHRGHSVGAPEPCRVVATAERLTVERRGRHSTGKTIIPAAQLEELLLSRLPNGIDRLPWPLSPFIRRMAEHWCHITARSDDLTVSFGRHLPYNELRYLHAVLYRMLAGSR